jgi:hypothetical protein
MNKSKLRQLVKEAMGVGYTKNPQTGEIETTQGGTTNDFMKILTRLANDLPEKLEEVNRQQAISYLKSNDATQYSVDASRGASQRFREKQEAIEAIANSPYNTFKIQHQGDRIRVYIPSDAGFEDMVRSMGSLD